jgi:hypothetical protein
MKYTFLFIIILISGYSAMSQPNARAYAYARETSPGTIPVGVTDENGNKVRTSKMGYSREYFIYLVYDNCAQLTPVRLLINGRAYQFKNQTIDQSPVAIMNNNIPGQPKNITLVPKTNDKIIRLIPELQKGINSTGGEKKLASSQVVISYRLKGKTYHKSVKTIKKLEPVLNL